MITRPESPAYLRAIGEGTRLHLVARRSPSTESRPAPMTRV